jgi:hypothetical protein
MPRSQGPPDRAAGPIAEFAYDLWELRRSAGDPAFRQMAQHAHITHTSLSRASKGETFPTWPVTRAYVLACNADIDEWKQRWEDAQKRAESAKRSAVDAGAPPASRTEPMPAPDEGTHRPRNVSSQDTVLLTSTSRHPHGAHRRTAKRPTVQLWPISLAYLHIIMLIILATWSISLSLQMYLIQTPSLGDSEQTLTVGIRIDHKPYTAAPP